LWATQRLLPYTVGGEFACGLEAGREAALAMRQRLAADPRFVLPVAPPALDIVVWTARGRTVEEASARSQAIFVEARSRDLYLALATLPARLFPAATWPGCPPDAHVTCLRSVMMKPEHRAWVEEIGRRLGAATDAVFAGVNPR
jgi:hypothetical protein